MNQSVCDSLREEVEWEDPRLLSALGILILLDLMVILGNLLVVAAVFISSKLRSVTNMFIVSLAIADLMVGVAVLPFSATWEVFKVWIFGDLWCSAWLALDVWMCTASILNLCAISLDRYVAVTRPVTYPSIMSMGRAKILIAAVWVLSFVICFPPLVGWKDKESVPPTIAPEDPPCPWICELTNETGYVVYSAMGSFYIPMFVMLFFYWRIYRAAVQTTRAINQGFRTTKGSKLMGSRFDEQRLTLRIHRGRGSVMQGSSGSNSNSTATTTTNSAANSVSNSPRNYRRPHEKIKISVSYPSSDAINAVANQNSSPGGSFSSSSPPSCSSQPGASGGLYAVHYSGSETSTIFRSRDHLRVTGGRLAAQQPHSHRRGRRASSSPESTSRPRLLGDPLSVTLAKDLSPSPTNEDNQPPGSKPKLISRMGKRNIKAQVKRFRMETKAAKTLGIIVGGFIFCWLPFFTMYLIRAFCIECINSVLFSVMFWLGYCNSAINPCIYALFSKDFRFAFKRIICRCFCVKEVRRRSSRYHRRGSDGSQIAGAKSGRSASYNHDPSSQPAKNSLGDNSDPDNEPCSDSR
ncbi:hypothetical protein LSTR_LSTR004563 [Laodelphax striatellus]|uniref:G-protein coupled receptors family 1 profile domain-containing protein n=1 Tax=Laodelphax striatellus TaxID=195883 RepID=A0A482WTE1_LAOST|nr:hypothetical protein LSTR_LSTR004563 [Laodelphax striatellus]